MMADCIAHTHTHTRYEHVAHDDSCIHVACSAALQSVVSMVSMLASGRTNV